MAPSKTYTPAKKAWNQRRIDAGLCVRCGKPRNKSKRHCDSCLLKRRRQQRDTNGTAWRPGGAGRPPLTVNRD